MRIRVHRSNLAANQSDGGDRPVVLVNHDDGRQRLYRPFVLTEERRDTTGELVSVMVLRIGYDKIRASVWVEAHGDIEEIQP